MRYRNSSKRIIRVLILLAVLCSLVVQFGWLIGSVVEDEPNDNPVPSSPKIQRNALRWKDGCLASSSSSPTDQNPGLPSRTQLNDDRESYSPPSGLVVTMALAPKNRYHLSTSRDQICNNLPNQWEWFLHPQGMDMLLVVQDEDKRWNSKRFARCLNLTTAATTNNTAGNNNTARTRTWDNLDGTQLTTTEYHYHGQRVVEGRPSTIKIFLANTVVEYPRYIRNNYTLLNERKNGPPGCSARLRYLQGCRWYTQEMLHLGILREYDYFLKMDTDIIFRKSPSFYLLQDMSNKRAVFAHAAEYHPKGDGSCAPGIVKAVSEFVDGFQMAVAATNQGSVMPPWRKRVCSNTSPEIQRDADQYYCNFVIGKVEYFQSPWVLAFANFLSEYPQGFFKQKWGDQIFWHFAMGLFLDRFTDYVVDYTDLRCKPDPACWYSVFDLDKYGANATEQCGDLERGIFVHSKSLEYARNVRQHAIQQNMVPSVPEPIPMSILLSKPLFRSTYPYCNP